MGQLTEDEKIEARELFHTLWTKDVGTPKYNKKLWFRLQELMIRGMGPKTFPTVEPVEPVKPKPRTKKS